MRRRTFVILSAGAAALAAGLGAALMRDRSAPPDALFTPQAPDGKLTLRAHKTPVAVPVLSFEDEAGQRRTLADFRGRHVLLNVWATWCAPCREEMPSLDRIQLKLGGADFQVLALSVDSGGIEAVRKFYAELGLKNLGMYVDRSLQVNSALRIVGLPSTVLLDPEGREIARHIGPAEWDSPRMVESIMLLTRSGIR
jgi:thiol-disulfide isomerase/thioredoxin